VLKPEGCGRAEGGEGAHAVCPGSAGVGRAGILLYICFEPAGS
jgi:hypothetical protein